jgi:hypothetical protein
MGSLCDREKLITFSQDPIQIKYFIWTYFKLGESGSV